MYTTQASTDCLWSASYSEDVTSRYKFKALPGYGTGAYKLG